MTHKGQDTNGSRAVGAGVTIVVNDAIRKMFADLVVNGKGGQQNLSKAITAQLATGDTCLHFTAEEFRRVVRYATAYGDGTFQRRLQVIIVQWAAQNFDSLVK